MSEAHLLSKQYPFTFSKYHKMTGKSLERRLALAAYFHDDGKDDRTTTNRWQRACQLDYQNFLNWKGQFQRDFREYSIKYPNKIGWHLRKAGVRHEIQSLIIHEKKNLPLSLKAAIAAHHGKLGFNFENHWINNGGEQLWKAFQRESNRVIDEKMDLLEVARLHYEFAGPRGLLQLADHRASAIEDGDWIPDHKTFSFAFPYAEKRNVQKLVEKHWEEDLLLIRAATGAGKTDASLLWASKQVDNGRAERLVITMPTRFTSNALSISVAENLSKIGLYHSSAWFNVLQGKIETGKMSRTDASKEHEFARLLQTPVTVCTIDHLLMALTLTREDHHLILFNLANSCLVIDEADFYDEFTQANILVLLDILKCWNVPILLMSASLPESILPSYQRAGFSNLIIREDNLDTGEYERIRFKIKSIANCESPSDIEDLLGSTIEIGNAIIYANTVDRAMHFYEWYEKKKVNVCLYHGRFTEPDKIEKERRLLGMLGKDAWDRGTAKGIAILTQIGEMSINISADIMITDLCPIDRFVQRAGRLCRFANSKIGELHVLIPQKDGAVYPAPYGSYNLKRQQWECTEFFEETRRTIGCEEYSTEKLVRLLNKIYGTYTEFTVRAITNANNLKEYFKTNWLVNSRQISKKNDFNINFWKSRNIPPQETVFVNKPVTEYFSNYLSFQNWKLKNSVELPAYLVAKGRKSYLIDTKTVIIKDEEETIFVLKEGLYSFDVGVRLDIAEQFL